MFVAVDEVHHENFLIGLIRRLIGCEKNVVCTLLHFAHWGQNYEKCCYGLSATPRLSG